MKRKNSKKNLNKNETKNSLKLFLRSSSPLLETDCWRCFFISHDASSSIISDGVHQLIGSMEKYFDDSFAAGWVRLEEGWRCAVAAGWKGRWGLWVLAGGWRMLEGWWTGERRLWWFGVFWVSICWSIGRADRKKNYQGVSYKFWHWIFMTALLSKIKRF